MNRIQNIGAIEDNDPISVAFLLSNGGSADLTDMVYSLDYPAGLTYVSISIPFGAAGSYNDTTKELTMTQLPPGNTEVTFNFTLADASVETYEVTLAVKSTTTTLDTDPSDNSITVVLMGANAGGGGGGGVTTARLDVFTTLPGPTIVITPLLVTYSGPTAPTIDAATDLPGNNLTLNVAADVSLISLQLLVRNDTLTDQGGFFRLDMTIIGGQGAGTDYNTGAVDGTSARWLLPTAENATVPGGALGFPSAPTGDITYSVLNGLALTAGQSTTTITFSGTQTGNNSTVIKATW